MVIVMRYAWLLTAILGLGSGALAGEYTRSAGPPARRLAVQGLHVHSDRWPDTYSLRSFALDVLRLERTQTEEEEALALYNWIARLMTIGGSPYEGPPGRETVVADTLKYLNVYGNHWCDGNARLLETAWRSLGREGFRLYIPMRHHSLVELLWRDTDGQLRWHALDVNNGWFVRNKQGWIASSEDIERNPLLVLAANQDFKMRTKGWLHTHLSTMPDHSMAIHLRRGERYSLRWDNEGYYYVNPRTRATVSTDNALYRPNGVYSQFIGGGESVFVPDLTDPRWQEDLAAVPENVILKDGRLGPERADRTGSFTYVFDFPHLIAGAAVEATIVQTGARASAAIEISTDAGKTWSRAWTSEGAGTRRIAVDLGPGREKAGLPSVLGVYSYLIRFQLRPLQDAGEVFFTDLKFTHRTMLNKMALPNLQPGWNRIKAAAQSVAPGSALRITLEWVDKDGAQRAESVASHLPVAFDVFANCSGGAVLRMRSLKLEATAPPPAPPADMITGGPETARIRAIINAGSSRGSDSVEPLIQVLRGDNEELRYWAADALGKIGDGRAVPVLIASLRDEFDAVRMSACVALGDLKAKDAVPALMDTVTGRIPRGKGYRLFIPEDVGEVRWMAARALGRIGDPRAVHPLMQILPGAGGDLGLFVARALGELGDRRAVQVLIEQSRRRNEPELRGIAEALGMLGDKNAIPTLRELFDTGKKDVRRAAEVALERLKDSSGNR